MEWNLRENGDFIEIEYSDFILKYIPNYSEIWCRYIGNDGTAHMAEIIEKSKGGSKSAPESFNRERKIVSEYLYTCLESTLLLKHISDKDFVLNKNFAQYLNMQNDFLAFHANSGRIHDSIKQILTIFCLDEASKDKSENRKLNATASKHLKKLYDYYQERNTVIHGKKLPFGEIYGNLLIPVPEGEPTNSRFWHSSKSWDEVNESDLTLCTDYLRETFMGVVVNVNGIFGYILSIIKDILAKNNYVLVDPPVEKLDRSSSWQGSSGFGGISGSQPT